MSLANVLKKGVLHMAANFSLADVARHGPYSPPTLASLADLALATKPDWAATDPKQSPNNLGDLTSHQVNELIASALLVDAVWA